MRYLPALILDVVLVLVFAVIGRASHDEDPLGFLLTAWPFLVALLVGHLVAALLPARPRRPWSPAWGAVVWLVTVAGGLLLRVAAGDTAQVPFIIVATLVLGVLLVGWRVVAALVRRRGARGRDQSPVDETSLDETSVDGTSLDETPHDEPDAAHDGFAPSGVAPDEDPEAQPKA